MIKRSHFAPFNMTREKEIIFGSVVFLLYSLVDGALTLWGLRIGAIEEVNPLMLWLIEKSLYAFMIIKLLLPIILGFIFWRIWKRSHKFVAYSLRLVVIVYTVVILFHIYWIMFLNKGFITNYFYIN